MKQKPKHKVERQGQDTGMHSLCLSALQETAMAATNNMTVLTLILI